MKINLKKAAKSLLYFAAALPHYNAALPHYNATLPRYNIFALSSVESFCVFHY